MTDHIPADKLREIIHSNTFQGEVMEHRRAAIIEELKALIAPPLRTLADMAPEEREACLWMQVYPPHHLPGAVLTDPGGHGLEPRVMYQDGATFTVEPKDVTPLPGEPKLGWPGGGADDETTPPHPEDVPDPQPGEAWLVNTREGEQREALKAGNRWYVKDGDDVEEWVEGALAPIARLVPEVEL